MLINTLSKATQGKAKISEISFQTIHPENYLNEFLSPPNSSKP